MSTLTALLRKAVAVGLLAAVAALGYHGIVAPVIERERDLGERLAEQRMLLGRLQAGLAETGARPVAAEPGIGVFLNGESDSIRIAGLQTLLGGLAETAGARLQSAQVVEPRLAADVRLIGIDAQLVAGLDQMQQILHALETHEPPLFVDDLGIVAAGESEDRPASRLTVRLVVRGAAPERGG